MMRILLVATDPGVVEAIRGVLAASTTPVFEVDHAANLSEALKQAAEGSYDALLLDARNAETQLREELAVARDQAAQATATLSKLAHDLATPLGVVMGMSQMLLSEDIGLNNDDRACLEDIGREALRACAILDGLKAPASDIPPITNVDRPSAHGSGSKIVVIADDDAAMRHLISVTLASDQYRLLQAADGGEAWRLIREHHPAVAILDWQMPVYNGLELTAVIKGDPLVRDMTVIMLTGRSGEEDRRAGARAQADVYLIKPFAPHELLAAVEQALGIAH
jgi:DNA-binding response OmpR family regulator